MSHMVQFRRCEEVLYFAIAGNISNHIDSIAACVRYRIAESTIQSVLLDLRNTTGRPSPAKLFVHVLKYPPMHHVSCALICGEHNREILALYAKLMQNRGHSVQLFASIEDGMAWLQTEGKPRVATDEKSENILRRLFRNMLDAYSIHAKA